MKTTARLALGIFLGAICGVVVAGLILQIEAVRESVGVYAFDFEVAFGRSVGEHILFILKILGALASAAIGGSLAVSIRWFAALGTLLAGIVIGGTLMFFVEVKNVKYVSELSEQSNADEEAYYNLISLRAIERGKTNQSYLIHFQINGRMALSNYVHQMEETEISGPIAFFGTNAAAYKWAKKYLATHTNSPSLVGDF